MVLDVAPGLGELQLKPDSSSGGFFDRFEFALDRRMDEVFADRLHALKLIEWSVLNPTASAEWLQDRMNSAAGSALTKSFEYGLRDAATTLPLLGWLQTRGSILGSLFADSVDAVEEESVSTYDISYRATERSWWRTLAEGRSLRFGVRPLRTNPYAFLSSRIREAGQTLLLVHFRYYFQNFSDHRFEIATSIPLPGHMTLDLGTYYQFGSHETERRAVMKVFKQISRNGIAHI
ncbi:MAG: hypothetical protein RLY20_3518, partial [Verrucomicrobiota bacterium]